ncbi:MAG: RnfABCDGE type electron transport complex subunit D [Treponema sp.]|nr:RnfABCDGE type electron transport complex subunit D [Treponema sp.]
MPESYFPPHEKLQFSEPQVNLARRTPVRMWIASICAFMVVIQSSLGDSFASLTVALSAVAAAVITEFIILYRVKKTARELLDGSAVASALILAILLPNQIPPLHAAFGAVFAIAVVKHSFGGLGSNWLNPAAAGWLFIRFSWPASFSQALSASPLSHFFTPALHIEAVVPTGAGFLSEAAYSLYAAMLASSYPGIIADRGWIALLFGAVIMLVLRVNRFWIPLAYVAVFSLLVSFAAALPHGGLPWSGDVIFSLLSGGTLVAAFLLANDPVTAPKTNVGTLIAVVAMAVITFFFRFYGAEPYGAFYAVVFVNASAALIRAIERYKLYERFS